MAERKPRSGAPDPHALGGASHSVSTLAQLNAKVSDASLAPIASPTFTGTVLAAAINPSTDTNDLGTATDRWDVLGRDFSSFLISGDAQPWFKIDGVNDYLLFGPGGAGAPDVRLAHFTTKLLFDDNASGPVTLAVEGILRAEGVSGTAAAALDLDDGATIGVGSAGEVRLRSNAGIFQISENGGAFAAPGGGGTLDAAYDFGGAHLGRTINVDASFAVLLSGGGTPPAQSVDTLLHLHDSTAVGSNVELSLTSGTSGFAIINFGDSADEDAGSLSWSNIDGALTGFVGAQEIWRFDASGIRINAALGTGIGLIADGDINANLFAVDATAERVEILKDDGILPTLSADTLLALLHDNAGAGSAELSIISGTSGTSILNFGDTVDEDAASIQYFHTSGVGSILRGAVNIFRFTSTLTQINSGSADRDFQVSGDTLSHMLFMEGNASSENVALLAAALPNWQSGDRIMFVGDATTAPTGDPSSGGFMYSLSGAGTWRGSSGTITTFGPSGPHCGECGYDAWTVASHNVNWKSWHYECGNCGVIFKGGPASVLDELCEKEQDEIIRKDMDWEEVLELFSKAA